MIYTHNPEPDSNDFIDADETETTSIKLEVAMQFYKMFHSPWKNWIKYRLDEIYAKACAWEEQRRSHPRQAGKA